MYQIKKLVSKENHELKFGNYDLTFGNFKNTFTGNGGDMETLDYIFSRCYPIFCRLSSHHSILHLFRACSNRCSVRVVETRLPLPPVISASLPFSYSDHEAVETSLIVDFHSNDQRKQPLPPKLSHETSRKVRDVLLGDIFKTEAHQKGRKCSVI